MNKFKNLFKNLYLKFSNHISEVEEDFPKIDGYDPNDKEEYSIHTYENKMLIKYIKSFTLVELKYSQ